MLTAEFEKNCVFCEVQAKNEKRLTVENIMQHNTVGCKQVDDETDD